MDRLIEKMQEIFIKSKEKTNTIHCLTNTISQNDLANVILFLNQSPIMADCKKESYEITKNASSLLINLGNIQEDRMISMEESIKAANKYDIPISLDLVGVSASKFRLDFANYLINNYKFDLIKGNYSEIYSLEKNILSTAGVDSKKISRKIIIEYLKNLNEKYQSIFLASGKEDIILSSAKGFILKNGDERLKKITGTGCILGAICSSLLACDRSIEAIILAVCIENISSENISDNLGLFSFKNEFLDNISLIDFERIKERIKYEKI